MFGSILGKSLFVQGQQAVIYWKENWLNFQAMASLIALHRMSEFHSSLWDAIATSELPNRMTACITISAHLVSVLVKRE